MPRYKITRKSDNATAVIEAARYERDGAGDRFYDENENIVSAFSDGILSDVTPESVEFTVPVVTDEEPTDE